MYKTSLPNLKHKPFGGAWCIHDKEQAQYRDQKIVEWTKQKNLNHNEVKNSFFNKLKYWMFSTHTIQGCEKFTECCYTHGTTETFSQFYIRYRTKRLRLFRADYFYHEMMQKLWYQNNFEYIDNSNPIQSGDVVVLSVPFSNTGNIPQNLEQLLSQCDQKDVPVLLDLAYLNISENLDFNLEHPCIQYITTSLSKTFPLEHNRIGIRLQRKKDKFEDQLYVINEDNYNYIPLMNCWIATEMLKEFPADYIVKKYKGLQLEYCERLNLEPSSCVIFGLDYNNSYPEYKRSVEPNRLCFSRVWDGRMPSLD